MKFLSEFQLNYTRRPLASSSPSLPLYPPLGSGCCPNERTCPPLIPNVACPGNRISQREIKFHTKYGIKQENQVKLLIAKQQWQRQGWRGAERKSGSRSWPLNLGNEMKLKFHLCSISGYFPYCTTAEPGRSLGNPASSPDSGPFLSSPLLPLLLVRCLPVVQHFVLILFPIL